MRPSCARCHSNALFVTIENDRLWVGWEIKPGEKRKLSSSFVWEQPESSSHRQLFFVACSYPWLCLLVDFKKTHQDNKHTRKHTSTFVTPKSTFFQTDLWLLPATNDLGWLGLILVQQDGIAELWKYPSIISFLVLYLSKVISTSVVSRRWNLF